MSTQNRVSFSEYIFALCELKSFTEALTAVGSAKQNNNRENDLLYFVTASLLSTQGKIKEAREYFSRAIKANKNVGIYYYQRALMNYGLGDIKEAESDCKNFERLGYNTESAKLLYTEIFYKAEKLNLHYVKPISKKRDNIIESLVNTFLIAKEFGLTIIINYEIMESLYDIIIDFLKEPKRYFDEKHIDIEQYKTQLKELAILRPTELTEQLDVSKKYIWFTTYIVNALKTCGYDKVQDNIVLWVQLHCAHTAGDLHVMPYIVKPFELNSSRSLLGNKKNIERFYSFINNEVNKC